ncbi:hypothetical protein R1flu_017580 [Riccia fluitans]|uniref:Uncharacterized protein n=1 Tax=Riccia fluitans TaxID=41844 RepID=A0ABD1ZDK1_9MARC
MEEAQKGQSVTSAAEETIAAIAVGKEEEDDDGIRYAGKKGEEEIDCPTRRERQTQMGEVMKGGKGRACLPCSAMAEPSAIASMAILHRDNSSRALFSRLQLSQFADV